MKKTAFVFLLVFTVAFSALGESFINSPDRFYRLAFRSELGTLSPLVHTLQIGETSTEFDYIEQGGQDILFPFERLEIELELFNNHLIKFLYQPLDIRTRSVFYEETTIDTVTFAAGTPMDLTYGFPFWRLTYLYDFHPAEDWVLAAGAALQLRNASIVFAELTGEALTVSQNLGPVPALSVLASKNFDWGLSLAFEATGSYASSAFFNGADFEFEGSLLDTALTAGLELAGEVEWIVGLRFIGGTAVGNSEYVSRTWSESRSTFTSNKLATLTVFTGLRAQ